MNNKVVQCSQINQGRRFMRSLVGAITRRVTNVTIASVLAFSSIAASLPLLLAERAAAADITTSGSLSLANAVAAASANDTILVAENETISSQIIITKPLTIKSVNGSVITVTAGINGLGIQSSNVTIEGITFQSDWNFGSGVVTRALEVSTANNITIKNNRFLNLRQPAYINNNTTGSIQNNYTDTTKGWVLLSDTNFTFSGNTWGNNVLDVAFIPAATNNYDDAKVVAISNNNNNAVVENQFGGNRLSDAYVQTTPTGRTGDDGSKWNPYVNNIQAALNRVVEGGTVHVANGSYTGTTMKFAKNGTTLVGESKSGVVLYPESSSGQAGVYASELNNITLKSVTVRPGTSLTAGAIIKLDNGTNGRIENVDVKASTAVNVSGIDINSFNNASLYNVYVNGVGKDGISVSANFGGTKANTSNNLSLNYVSVASAGWSGVALYTTSGGASTDITGLTIDNTSLQYNARGIYFQGTTDKSITGPSGAVVDLKNASLKNSTNQFIVNAQPKDIVATGASFDAISAASMNAAQLQQVRTKITDKISNSSLGLVKLQGLNAPTLTASNPLIANGATKTLTWNAPTTGEVSYYEYAEYNNTPPTSDSAPTSWTKNVSSTSTTDTAWASDVTIYYRVRAIDVAGEAGPWSSIGTIITDRTAPTISSLSLSPEFTNGNVVQVNGTVNDNNLKNYNIRVYKGDKSGQVSPGIQYTGTANVVNGTLADLNVTALPDGNYFVRVWADDLAGNRTGINSHIYLPFTIDRTGPTITVKAESLGSQTNKIYRNVSFKLFDTNKVDKVTINGVVKDLTDNQWSDVNGVKPGTFGAIEGPNTLVAYDVYGNTTTYEFTIDTIAPNGSFTHSNNNDNTLVNTDVTSTLTATESIQTPAGWTEVTGSEGTVFTKVSTANNKGWMTISDWAGNTKDIFFEVKRIDKTAPVLNIPNGAALASNSVEVVATEDNIQSITVNGSIVAYTGSKPNYSITITGDGTYTVVALDKAGNSTTTTFTLDTVAPTVTIIGTDTPTNPEFIIGTTNDPSATIIVSIDGTVLGEATIGSQNEDGSWNWSIGLPELAEGTYIISAVASDTANNSTTANPSFTYTVSSTPPVDEEDDEDDENGQPGQGPTEEPSNPTGAPQVGGLTTVNAGGLATPLTFALNTTSTPTATPNDVLAAQSTISDLESNGEVQAANTTSENNDDNEDKGCGKFLGLCWYWWVVIVVGILLAYGVFRASGQEDKSSK